MLQNRKVFLYSLQNNENKYIHTREHPLQKEMQETTLYSWKKALRRSSMEQPAPGKSDGIQLGHSRPEAS